MTVFRRVGVAGLLGMWIVAGAAQESAQDSTAEADAQQEGLLEDGSGAAGDAPEAETAEQPGPGAEAAVTDAVATDAPEAFPEIAPLDELFVPSQNIRADEPVTFPVDF